MRQGQHQKKNNRGRNRRQGNPGNRVFESNGPDVKIRGNASHVSEKYLTLARDAQASGDPIAAENYLQHAEHYLRIIAASQAQQSQNQPCAPDQAEKSADGGGRGDGQSQQRGRGRSNNGDGRGNREAQAQATETSTEEEVKAVNGAAAEEPAGKDGEEVVANGADQVNGEDVVVAKAPKAAKAAKDEPAADAAEEPAPEA